jgi:hypothetical protein
LLYDDDGDGVVDYSLNDFDADGYFETIGIDTSGDGIADFYRYDADADGYFESYAYDSDQNGISDVYVDSNGDGIVDVAFSDTNGDGLLDTAYLDTDLDGVFDATLIDTNSDGVIDSSPDVTPTTSGSVGADSASQTALPWDLFNMLQESQQRIFYNILDIPYTVEYY